MTSMAFSRQLNEHGATNQNTVKNSWVAYQNTRRTKEIDRTIHERSLVQHNKNVEEVTTLTQNEGKYSKTNIDCIRHNKSCDEKLKQHIRETSYELRELEARLRAAHLQQELRLQIAEKEALKLKSSLANVELVRQMDDETKKAEQDYYRSKIIRQQEILTYRQELDRQIQERHISKQNAYKEFLREKLIIDEVAHKIDEEDQQEMERKLACQRTTRELLDECIRQREKWKATERERMAEENRHIQEYILLQEQRKEILNAERCARKRAVDEIQCKLAERIQCNRDEREQQELVRQELYFEEQQQTIKEREHEETKRRIRQRLELQRERNEQIKLKAYHDEHIKHNEEIFRRELMAKFAEDDCIEQMNVQRRHMKQLEHNRAIDYLLEERRRQRKIEKQRELDERHEVERMELIRKEIIEQERIKIFREHAHKLLDDLPKRIIPNENDLVTANIKIT